MFIAATVMVINSVKPREYRESPSLGEGIEIGWQFPMLGYYTTTRENPLKAQGPRELCTLSGCWQGEPGAKTGVL